MHPRRRLGRLATARRASFDRSAASRGVRPLKLTVRPRSMALPFHISSATYGPRFHELGSGRFHQLDRGVVSPFIPGFRFVLVENELAQLLRATVLEGVSFEEAVLYDPRTGEERTTHTCLRVHPCFQHPCDLPLDGARMWMIDDMKYFVSPTLKEILERTRWISYLRLSQWPSDFMDHGSAG